MGFDPVTLGAAKRAMVDSTGRRLNSFQVAARPTKRAAYSFGGAGSNGGTTSVTEAAVRFPFRLTVDTTRFRVHVRNHDFKGDTAGVGTINFTGMWLGEHALSTSTGTPNGWTGGFVSSPSQVSAAFTVIDDAEWVSPWIETTSAQIARDKQMLLSFGFTCPTSTTIYRTFGSMFFASGAGNAALAGQTGSLGSYFGSPGLFDVFIEYEFAGTNPVGLYLGDSLTEGRAGGTIQGIDPGGQDAGWPQQHAQRTGAVAMVNAYSGITASQWAFIDSTKWTRFDPATLRPDYVFIWMGTNDIGNNVDSLATIKGKVLSVINKVRALYGNGIPIYTATILPRGFTGTQETNRTAMNAWLSARPKNIAGCFDFDRAVRDPASVAALDADFDSGDATHLNTRGYSRLVAAIGGPILTIPAI